MHGVNFKTIPCNVLVPPNWRSFHPRKVRTENTGHTKKKQPPSVRPSLFQEDQSFSDIYLWNFQCTKKGASITFSSTTLHHVGYLNSQQEHNDHRVITHKKHAFLREGGGVLMFNMLLLLEPLTTRIYLNARASSQFLSPLEGKHHTRPAPAHIVYRG